MDALDRESFLGDLRAEELGLLADFNSQQAQWFEDAGFDRDLTVFLRDRGRRFRELEADEERRQTEFENERKA